MTVQQNLMFGSMLGEFKARGSSGCDIAVEGLEAPIDANLISFRGEQQGSHWRAPWSHDFHSAMDEKNVFQPR